MPEAWSKVEEKTIGKWVVRLLYNEKGEVIAAELESPRGKRILVSRGEHVAIDAPKRVIAFLQKLGFHVEKAV